MKLVKISTQNQITLPAGLLSELDLKPSDRLIIEGQKGQLLLKPLRGSVVEQTAGSLTAYVSPAKRQTPLLKVLKETQKKVAERLA